MSKPDAKARLAEVQESLRNLRISMGGTLSQGHDSILFNAIMQLGPLELIANSICAIDDETREALKFVAAGLRDQVSDLRRNEPPAHWKQIRLEWISQISSLEKHIAALERLVGEGE